jgi:hypothetical protein
VSEGFKLAPDGDRQAASGRFPTRASIVSEVTVKEEPRISVVIPVHNRRDLLVPTLDALFEAARVHGAVEVVLVDHASDGETAALLATYRDRATVLRLTSGHISAVRNFGARHAHGQLLSFLDADCVVPANYFTVLEDVFATVPAGATGCEVGIPDRPHWTERVWYELHVVRLDGFTHYLNSANFAIRRTVFDAIGGFDESLVTGEDTDICMRVRRHGASIYETQRLSVVHLGNPKSLGAFYRKQVWHGLGAFGGALRSFRNKASVMVVAHGLATILAALTLVVSTRVPMWTRIVAAALLCVVVPSAAVAYRVFETKRLPSPLPALVLYVTFFFARCQALLIVARRAMGVRRPEPARTLP